MKISNIEYDSIVNGPGLRTVIYTQGCFHNCTGCHNPETHSFNKGLEVRPRWLVNTIKAKSLTKRVTISGGEPLVQKDLVELLEMLKERDYDVWLYTGYELSKLQDDYQDVMAYCDAIVAGRFDESLLDTTSEFRGSTNQTIWRREDERN